MNFFNFSLRFVAFWCRRDVPLGRVTCVFLLGVLLGHFCVFLRIVTGSCSVLIFVSLNILTDIRAKGKGKPYSLCHSTVSVHIRLTMRDTRGMTASLQLTATKRKARQTNGISFRRIERKSFGEFIWVYPVLFQFFDPFFCLLY